MHHSPTRRRFMLAAATLPVSPILAAYAVEAQHVASTDAGFARLEEAFGGRLGVAAYDTANGVQIRYRADERFPMCSTFKLMLVGAILAQSAKDAGLLQRHVRYAQDELVTYSPVTEKHVADGMTVAELCDAAMRYSDNTAANLLIRMLGSPAAVTAFARSIGDHEFRLDRYETELNTALPGDERDTSTPAAMERSLRTLVLGDVLPLRHRKLLEGWLRNNTTGARRIRAGLPAGWDMGDKTGSGAYGTTNDAALIWPPGRAPVSLAVYYTQRAAGARSKEEIVAAAAGIVADALR